MTWATKADGEYSPRPGSACALALEALIEGPQTSECLAAVIGVEPKQIHTRVHRAIEAGAILRYQDESGVLHFTLKGYPVAEGFKPYVQRAQPPVKFGGGINLNVNDPFNLIARRAGA